MESNLLHPLGYESSCTVQADRCKPPRMHASLVVVAFTLTAGAALSTIVSVKAPSGYHATSSQIARPRAAFAPSISVSRKGTLQYMVAPPVARPSVMLGQSDARTMVPENFRALLPILFTSMGGALALALLRLTARHGGPVIGMAAVMSKAPEAIVLPDLPYGKDDLMPHISRETIEYHHGKHHLAYVNKLNELLLLNENKELRGKSLEEIVKRSSGALYNQAAQVWNHNFYWSCLKPNPNSRTNMPKGALLELIEKDFGSFAAFKDQFSAACLRHFGSGWVWLAYDGEALHITEGHDAENLLKDDTRDALLTCDVWEHAYYIDRANARPAYVEAWWNLVNWQVISTNLAKSQQKRSLVALSALENMVLGGFSGAMACATGMPLLTLKFCTQAGQPLPAAFTEWYRGVVVQSFSAAPVAAFQMCANGMMSRIISGCSPLSPELKRELTNVERIGAAASAGIFSALLYTPVDLLTIQQQKLSKGLAEAFVYIVQHFGPMGLLHGALAMSIRECVFVMGMFGLTPIISEALVKRFGGKRSLITPCRMVGSIFAGVFAALVTQPVDTVKTCIQADIQGVTYRNVWQAIALVARERGLGSLYQGVVPRTCLLILSFFITTLLKANAEKFKTNRHFAQQLAAEGISIEGKRRP